MKDLIIENQRLEEERDKFRTKYRRAISEKVSYKQIANERAEKIKTLELEKFELNNNLSLYKERCIKLENDVASLSAELSKKNADIQAKIGENIPKDGTQDICIINNVTIENIGVSKSGTKIEKLETDNVYDINKNDIVKLFI